jgi:hypothetical protein
VTPSVRDGHTARLERRNIRRGARRREAQVDAALEALSDEQMERGLLLGRRCQNDGPESLSAEEMAELEGIFGPIMALYGPDDEPA